MDLYKSKQYMEDIDQVVKRTSVLEKLRNSSVFITGATGLIGSAITDILLRYNEIMNGGIDIYVAGRSEKRTKKRFSRYSTDSHFYFVPYNATGNNVLNFHADYIIHGASNSSPKDIMANTIDTMLDNFTALYELLLYAEKQRVKTMLFISTSEVYGEKETIEPFSEDQYGYVDILNPRSSYSSGKRAGETLCSCFSAERGIKTVIVRPGHIYGPTAKSGDSHVSSCFAFNAAAGEDLILKSAGTQLRSYCYSLDAAAAILTVLVRGENASAYNISNPASVITIKTMTEYLAKAGGVNVTYAEASRSEKAGYNPMQNSSLKSEKLQKLGWQGLFDAQTGFDHTVRIIKESNL